ncbi:MULTISPECIES: hypothetical protein [Bacillaceae]|uniref:Uncharacterized protein n=1 Tax=Alkalicoccobacillus plakortidis TaxID=444060 RepID=A0A9D5I1E0_9BACI|nr:MULTISPECIES: hypothetical protein [Bacillaceae]KQL57579.1 hypothetical protein AN965_08780 [Alkalicoccobacillus plakortidis]
MIERIKEEYGFKQASLESKHQLNTEKGVKQICYWEDEACLKWHIEWRDNCSVAPYVMMNRMLRTNKGAAYIEKDKQFISLHDKVPIEQREDQEEKRWGEVLGLMIQAGRRDQSTFSLPKEVMGNDPILEQANREQRLFFQTLFQEGNRRLTMAKKLAKSGEISVPKMDSFTELTGSFRGHMLIVQGSETTPEYGYQSFKTFLKSWYERKGEASLHALMNELDEKATLTSNERKAIMATVLIPDELDTLLQERAISNDQPFSDLIDHLKREWDKTQSFASALAKWLDAKKVTT